MPLDQMTPSSEPMERGTGLDMASSNQGNQFTGALTTGCPGLDSYEAIYDLAPLKDQQRSRKVAATP